MNNIILNNIIEVNGLCKTFKDFALRDVSFALPKGFVMGFIGPNGAGKTTTIKTILGMLVPDSGVVRLFGREGEKPVPLDRERIGIVLDCPFFPREWNLRDLERGISGFYGGWSRETYAGLLKRFGLDVKKKIRELSRGMQMKLMIAVALSHGAELLILDEPTSGLDPAARDELMDILREFIADENKGVLFSTHITSDLEKIADYVTLIVGGSIVFTGVRDAFLEAYALIKGGPEDLTPELEAVIMGCRAHSAGFSALIRTVDLGLLPEGVHAEQASFDDIIVYMTREGDADEKHS